MDLNCLVVNTIHYISQDYFGYTTNLMSLIKSYILAKNANHNLAIYNDALENVKFDSDISIKILPDYFKGMPLELFRKIKQDPNSTTFTDTVLRIFKKQYGDVPVSYRSSVENMNDDVDYIFYYEWFPKVFPMGDSINGFNLKIFVDKPSVNETYSDKLSVFHVKNKSLLGLEHDIKITDYVIERYVSEFRTPRSNVRFVGGCEEMVEYFTKKYDVPRDSHVRLRPLYHREKGNMNSVLFDVWNCSRSNFVTNDFLFTRYYSDIAHLYTQIPPEVCFFNSLRKEKHIFSKDLCMSNYFDMFVVLQQRLGFLI